MARHHSFVGTAIGREMEDVGKTINTMQQKAVTALTQYDHSIDQTIAMLFSDDDIARSQDAKCVTIAPYGNVIVPVLGAVLTLDFDDSKCHPIRPERSTTHPTRSVPLFAYIKQVEAIYLQYEEVKAVMRWLNKNATLNAIRYYFPAALKLAPHTFAGMEPSTRHQTPDGVHDWLQAMRDAAATVASAVMIPDDTAARQRNDMCLTFNPCKIQRGSSIYTTDQITFNI